MNKLKIDLSEIYIQENINCFVEKVIFKDKTKINTLMESKCLEDLFKKGLIKGVQGALNHIRFLNKDYSGKIHDFQQSFLSEFFIHNNEINVLDAFLKNKNSLVEKYFDNKEIVVGVLQKYVNIMQKYIYCIAKYEKNSDSLYGRNVASISNSLRKEAERYIEKKILDCPLDSIVFQNISCYFNEYSESENIVPILNATKVRFNKNKDTDVSWSKLNEYQYKQIQSLIQKSIESKYEELSKNSRNNKFIKDSTINKGLLFDIVFWKRKDS